jgi:hypothetical protein
MFSVRSSLNDGAQSKKTGKLKSRDRARADVIARLAEFVIGACELLRLCDFSDIRAGGYGYVREPESTRVWSSGLRF